MIRWGLLLVCKADDKKLDALPLRSAKMPLPPPLFSIEWEVLANATKHKEDVEGK